MFLYDLSGRDTRFLKLLHRYRDVMTISLHDAAPQQRRIDIPRWGDLGAFCRKMPLPDDTARNVSLHLALHRRLMEDESYRDHTLFFNRYIQPVNERYRSGTMYESPVRKIIDAGEIHYEYARLGGMLTSGRLYRVGITKKDGTDAEMQLITRTEAEPEIVTASYPLGYLFPEEVLPAEIENHLNRHEPDFYYLELSIRRIRFLSPDEWVIHFEERPEQGIPQRLFHYRRVHQGKISKRRIPVDPGMFRGILDFSIIGLNEKFLYFSRIVSQGEQREWEYGRVSLADGNTLILAHHPASRDQVVLDGPVQVLPGADDLVNGAVSGPGQSIYFTHGDMVKVYQAGVIKTVAGRRDGDEAHPTEDCFWHPHVIGLDTAGRLFIKSSGKVTTPDNIQMTHYLKIIAPQ